jgi:hypothetical protein
MRNTQPDGSRCVTILAESDVERDLGIYVDNNLSFKTHIAQATKKANRVVGVIRRSFDYLDWNLFTQLFKSLVRPMLEYGNSVWNPYLKGLRAEIENVQRRATKLIPDMNTLQYEERLAALDLPSLEFRRKRGDMIEAYKYLHDMYNVATPKLVRAEYNQTRGNSLKLYKPLGGPRVRSRFFSQRIINSWNSLPDSVITAPSVNAFKNRLDKFWRNDPRKFAPACYIAYE